jgi:hypothetical protein
MAVGHVDAPLAGRSDDRSAGAERRSVRAGSSGLAATVDGVLADALAHVNATPSGVTRIRTIYR